MNEVTHCVVTDRKRAPEYHKGRSAAEARCGVAIVSKDLMNVRPRDVSGRFRFSICLGGKLSTPYFVATHFGRTERDLVALVLAARSLEARCVRADRLHARRTNSEASPSSPAIGQPSTLRYVPEPRSRFATSASSTAS